MTATKNPGTPGPILRWGLAPKDRQSITDITSSSGFFSSEEIALADELAGEFLRLGRKSGYDFVLAEESGVILGYACQGHIPCTRGRHHLYWMAVREEARGRGIGARLMAAVLKRVESQGGTRIYAETSGRDQYRPTRKFYEAMGFRSEAVFRDYYRPGEDMITYARDLHPENRIRPEAREGRN